MQSKNTKPDSHRVCMYGVTVDQSTFIWCRKTTARPPAKNIAQHLLLAHHVTNVLLLSVLQYCNIQYTYVHCCNDAEGPSASHIKIGADALPNFVTWATTVGDPRGEWAASEVARTVCATAPDIARARAASCPRGLKSK